MPLVINDYEAYLLVEQHLLEQQVPAKDSSDDCVYRGYKPSTLDELREQSVDIAIEENGDYDDTNWDIFMNLLSETTPDAKCAVGCLITDDFYDQNMEGKTIESNNDIWDAVNKSNPLWAMRDSSFKMLKHLQSIHDNNPCDDWGVLLSRMVKDFDQYGDYTGEINE